MSENEISRDEGHAAPPRKLGLRTKLVLLGFVVGFVLLIALNMN